MTDADVIRDRRRRGWWLKIARDQAGLDQNAVAKLLGLKAGTSVLAWEKGRRDPDASQQKLLAGFYGVPVSMFADPQPTDEERVIDARAAVAREAIEIAREDLEPEVAPSPVAYVRAAAPRRRRTA